MLKRKSKEFRTHDRHKEEIEHYLPKKMDTKSKYFVGVLSFIPIAALTLMVVLRVQGVQPTVTLAIALFTLLLIFALEIFFGSYLFNNRRLTKPFRYLWATAFLVIPFFSLPVYWFKHVWNMPVFPKAVSQNA